VSIMEELNYLKDQHAIALLLVALAIALFVWIWGVYKIAAFGRAQYAMPFLRSKSMLALLVSLALFAAMLLLLPQTCAAPCDLDHLVISHVEIFGAAMAGCVMLALVINVKRSSLIFGLIFTLAQMTTAFMFVGLFFVAFWFNNDRVEREDKLRRARERAVGL
jgi:hypothetical protein